MVTGRVDSTDAVMVMGRVDSVPWRPVWSEAILCVRKLQGFFFFFTLQPETCTFDDVTSFCSISSHSFSNYTHLCPQFVLEVGREKKRSSKTQLPFQILFLNLLKWQIKHFQADQLIKLWIKIDIVMIQTVLLLISASDNATIAQRKANNILFLAIFVPF